MNILNISEEKYLGTADEHFELILLHPHNP